MDNPINIEKLQAMKIYRVRSVGLLPRLFQYLLSALALGLFLSRLCSSLMLLFSIPKYLFIVCNIIIIVYLAGDSKLSKASPATDIYEEYAKRNQKEMTKVESHLVDQEIDKEEEEEEDEEDEEDDQGLDGEEMKKKFDDFIAKVIMQRRIEASMQVLHE